LRMATQKPRNSTFAEELASPPPTSDTRHGIEMTPVVDGVIASAMRAATDEERWKLPPRCDPFALAEEPYAVYSRLRAAGPLLRGGPGVWVLPRHREVAVALRHPLLGQFRFDQLRGFSARSQRWSHFGDGPANSFMRRIVVATNGAEHTRLRKVMGAILTNRIVHHLRSQVEDRVDELLRAPAERGSFEAVSELAYPLPLQVLSRVLGIADGDSNTLGWQVLALSNLFAPTVSERDSAAADAAIMSLRDYFARLCNERLKNPQDDVIWALAAASKDADFSEEETVDNAIFLMFAGLETSMNLIAAGCAALAQHPGQFSKLRDHPGAALTAVHEFLRYDAPTQITGRVVLEPIEIAGRVLSKGRILLLLLGSANHDETNFSQPECLDIARDPNPHVSFGAGPHYCVGAKLALMEAEVAFEKVARKFSLFEPAGPAIRDVRATPRIYSKVPIRLTVAQL
jgi:cytochrome P450